MSVLAFVLVACCVCKGMCIHISHIIIIKLPLNFFREHIFVYILLLVWESYRDFEVLIHVWCINVVVILIPLYLGSIQQQCISEASMPTIRPDIILCPNKDSNAPVIWWFTWCHSGAVEDGWGLRTSSTVLSRCDPKECQSGADTGLPLFWLLSGVNSFVFLSWMKEETANMVKSGGWCRQTPSLLPAMGCLWVWVQSCWSFVTHF